ncbi:MAG TPA: sensor histidine kinase KdpD [Acidobacteriaceae bacterium]|nr:sensor histidine kinase KdpD [Acidobacteriaceae bacterium]
MGSVIQTKSPEEWLAAAESEKRGRFKIFLGYAPGVGKTFSMLSEAIRRRSRGEDIVVGFVETHGRARTAELAGQLEQVPRMTLEYKGTLFEEMDMDAILARRPQVVLIDELAHTNIQGSLHAKRYQDVLQILEAEIDVLSTLNIQHVESVTPRVQSLTGITVRETVPDWVLDRADEVVLADLTPEALVTRMGRGDIYPQERVERALSNFFRKGNLIALREMALQRVTRAIDRTLDDYVTRKKLSGNWQVAERVAVCISAKPESRDLIARGARMAEAMGAEFLVLYVDNGSEMSDQKRRSLAANIQFAENVGAQVARLKGKSVPATAAEYIAKNRITQVIFGRSAIKGWKKYLYYLTLQRVMRVAPHVDVHIVTQGER